MYANVWAKYLPVIRIVLKRSIVAEQIFALNIPDFHRTGMTRKLGYKFSVIFRDGKPLNIITDFPLASAFVSTLMEDAAVKELFSKNDYSISMNAKFELTIRHIPRVIVEQATEAAIAE